MKRDMDLVMAILQFAETNCEAFNQSNSSTDFPAITVSKLPEKFHSVEKPVLDEHVQLAVNRKLISADYIYDKWRIHCLTWEGHDFLDSLRDK